MNTKKKVIDKKLYDPNAARYLCTFKNLIDDRVSDAEAPDEKLYRTKSGNYFVLRGDEIIPISESKAKNYVETNLPERYEKIFCENKKIKKTLLLEPYTIELLEEIKTKEGVKKYSTIVDRAVNFYNKHSANGELIMPDSIVDSLERLESSFEDMHDTVSGGAIKYNELCIDTLDKLKQR